MNSFREQIDFPSLKHVLFYLIHDLVNAESYDKNIINFGDFLINIINILIKKRSYLINNMNENKNTKIEIKMYPDTILIIDLMLDIFYKQLNN